MAYLRATDVVSTTILLFGGGLLVLVSLSLSMLECINFEINIL